MEEEKYLSKLTLTQSFKLEIVEDIKFSPMASDSYNETDILKTITQLGSPKELLFCAINFAIIGYGKKKIWKFCL